MSNSNYALFNTVGVAIAYVDIFFIIMGLRLFYDIFIFYILLLQYFVKNIGVIDIH